MILYIGLISVKLLWNNMYHEIHIKLTRISAAVPPSLLLMIFSFPSHHFSSLTNVIISLPSHKWALSKLAESLLCQSFSEVYNRQTSMIFWTLIIKTLQPEITWPPLPDKMKTCKEIVSRTSSVQTSDEQRTITDSDQIYRKLSFFLS